MNVVILMAAFLGVDWHSDYRASVALAKQEKKMLFVSFGTEPASFYLAFSTSRPADHVFLRVPKDQQLDVEGRMIRLLDHEAFSHLRGEAGFAIIDYKNEGTYYGSVVSVLPFAQATAAERIAALFGLPGGSLTQRTLIWALRVHPERPRSTEASNDPALVGHAQRHSAEQARQDYQHHNLPSFAQSEIVAESWPWNRGPVEAALDMVDAWRQSPGHWSAASRPHRAYGYDMRSNGRKWYATGVFID